MVYGKLFKKLQEKYPMCFNNLSANKCSELTYKELRSIAKVLYADGMKDIIGTYYMRLSRKDLAKHVYAGLCAL